MNYKKRVILAKYKILDNFESYTKLELSRQLDILINNVQRDIIVSLEYYTSTLNVKNYEETN